MRINAIILALLLTSCTGSEQEQSLLGSTDDAPLLDLDGKADGYGSSEFKYVLVANRSDSTVSVLSATSGNRLGQITEQTVGFEFEPMYAVHLDAHDLVAVGDRKNSRVLVFDSLTLRFLGFVPTSEGVFHMWNSADDRNLFVVADTDNSVDVISFVPSATGIRVVRRVFDVADSVENGRPHDVVADDESFYVTVQVEDEQKDVVLKINRRTLAEEARLDVSLDSHVGMPLGSPFLLVPESVEGELNYVDRSTMQIASTVDGLPGAHGLFWDDVASRVFVANIGSTGPEAIYEIERTTGQLNASKASTIAIGDTKPHNITIDHKAARMYVTHSGPDSDGNLNTEVSIFDIDETPRLLKTVESGKNPFGILFVEN